MSLFYFRIDKTIVMAAGYVQSDYRRSGVGADMIQLLEQATIDMGIDVLSGISSTSHSQGPHLLSDYEVLLDVPYKGNYSLYEEMPVELQNMHLSCRVIAKRLV